MTSELYPRSSVTRQGDFWDRGHQNALDAKIVVLGNSGVGKTCLLQRYVQNNFDPATTTATTSAFFAAKRVNVDEHKVRLQLWDTAGQERFRSMAPIYYRGANAALLLYDITNYSTFEDLKTWLQELKKNCSPDLIIYIVGAKADLYRDRQVSSDCIRLNLHSWFPPAPRSASPTPSSPTPYARPRFTSLTNITTSHSVQFFLPTSRAAKHRSQSPPPELRQAPAALPDLKRCNTIMGSPSSPDLESAPSLMRRRTTSVMQPSLGQPRPDPPNSRRSFEESSTTQRPSYNVKATKFPKQEKINEDENDFSEFEADLNLRLFEVSAKDDKGVKELFLTLIRAIISKRAIIEREREMRERDSVYLNGGALTPTWAAVADSEDALHSAPAWKAVCC